MANRKKSSGRGPTDVGVVIVGADRTVEYICPIAAALFETTQDEAVGKPCKEVIGVRRTCRKKDCPVDFTLDGGADARGKFALPWPVDGDLCVSGVLPRHQDGAVNGAIIYVKRATSPEDVRETPDSSPR